MKVFARQVHLQSSISVQQFFHCITADSIVACLKGMYENQSNETSV